MRKKTYFSTFSSMTLWNRIFRKEMILKILGACILLFVLFIGGIWVIFLRGVPEVESIERGDYFQESTVIYDKDKKPIYTLFNDGKRTYAEYTEISDSIKNAIISTEDKTFFENPGFDVKGLVRAGLNYITGKTDKIKGTSTLSQQLISYTLLTKERSIKRKVQEAYLSYKLNKSYNKEKILEMYLNAISFGYNANGVEEASKTYFGKSAKEV
jgi:penicillin-binding protein 2A